MSNSLRLTAVSAPIGVFTALAWESAAIRAQLRHVKREGRGVWCARAGQRTIKVFTCGVGLSRAREILTEVAATPFAAIISAGCAGALSPHLTTGQLILASAVYMWSKTGKRRLVCFPTDSRLLPQVRLAAVQTAIPVAEGGLFTSETALCSPAEKIRHGKTTAAIAVDMESGIYAAFAQARGLPFLALRVILDPIELTLPTVMDLTTPAGNVRPLRAAAYIATHLQCLPVLLSLQRARTVVAQTLSRLCATLFPLL